MKPGAIKAEKAQSPAAPGGLSAMSRRARFAILFVIVGGVLGIWLCALFHAAKDQTLAGNAAFSWAGGVQRTPQQWASVRTASVEELVFQPGHDAEGKITVDEDRTASVVVPYGGRVTAVFAEEGGWVEPGRPLLRMDSTDLVQAQNDAAAGTAAVKKTRSQVTLTQKSGQRAPQSFVAKGGALKDWQQAPAGPATAQNGQKSAKIALAATKGRSRIIHARSGDAAAMAPVPPRTSPGLTAPPPSNEAPPPNPQASIASRIPVLAQFKKDLSDLGYELQLDYFADVLSNPSGGVKQGAAYEGLLYMALDADLAKIAGLDGLSFRVTAYQIHGRQLSAHNIFNFATVDSIEARPATRLFELWVEQKLGDLASIRVGQLAADNQFFIRALLKTHAI